MPPRKKTTEGVSSLIRKAGQQARRQAASAASLTAQGGSKVRAPRIFNIIDYIEQPWGLAMRLYPGQRFLVKLYYHLELDDREPSIPVTDMFNTKVLYRFTEKQFLRYLYEEGRCNIGEQDHERRELILPIGRRAGKTTLSAIFASYEVYRLLNLYNPQEYYGLPNGNRVQIISVATDKDQAGLLYNDVASHLAKCRYFEPYIANNTQTHVHFRTPYEIDRFGPIKRVQDGSFQSFQGKSSLRVTFKSCIARGLRGAGNIVVILDEVAHFQDNGVSSAKEIYDAITPSTAAFSPKDPDDNQVAVGPVEARIILISSPLGKSGKFWELFDLAMRGGEGSENLLAIQAPTWEINPTVESSYYKQKYHADPTVFMVEHGAQFSDQMRGWIEREADLLDCVDPDLRPHTRGRPRVPHQMGVDVGLVGDGTAVVVTHPEGDHIVLDYHEVWQAGVRWHESNPHLKEPVVPYAKGLERVERLDFDEIADWIATLCKHFHVTDGLFDRWNGIPLEQRLHKMGLKQFQSQYFTRDQASKIYQNTKLLLYDKRLRFYDYPRAGKKHSPLVQELLSLQARQVSKNLVLVEAPQLAGAHDDVADAFVRAVSLSEARSTDKKYVAGGGQFAGVPYAAAAASVARYQRARARRHGVFSDRRVR